MFKILQQNLRYLLHLVVLLSILWFDLTLGWMLS